MSHPNYAETLLQIGELRSIIERLEANFNSQIPQGITNEFLIAKDMFLNWVDEAEFTILNYPSLHLYD